MRATSLGLMGRALAASTLLALFIPSASAQTMMSSFSSSPMVMAPLQAEQPVLGDLDGSWKLRDAMEPYERMEDVVSAPAWGGWIYGQWIWHPSVGWITAGELAELLQQEGNVTYDPGSTRFYTPSGVMVPKSAGGSVPTLNGDLGKDPQGNPLPPCFDVCSPATDCAVRCFYELDTSELEQDLQQQEAALEAQGQKAPPRKQVTRVETTCGGYNVCKVTQPPAVVGTGAGTEECIAGTPESKWSFKFGKDDRYGDDFLGAGYSLAASLVAKTSAENGNQGDRQDAHAHAMAFVDVFGGRSELARVQGDAYAVYAKKAGAKMLLEVMGYTIYEKSVETNLNYTKALTVPFFKATTTFTIVFIPVTVGVSVDGEVGIHLEAGPLPDGLKGFARPWIRAYGTAWGGIGIPGFFIGVNCVLTFLEVQVPVTAAISIASNCLRWTFDLTLVLKTLGGKLSLQIEFLWIKELIKLFEWKGLQWDFPLIHQTGVVFFG